MGLLSMKGEKTMKKSTFGSRVRKRLSDITNIHSQQKSPLNDKENVLPVIHDSSSKKYVQQLLKENAVMVKLIQEKDKIIETKEVELEKLRVNVKKLQMQNWNLAQSNTQMIADLNMSKDKLKALQHDIACMNALYKAKILDLQAKVKCEETSSLFKKEGETSPKKETVHHPKKDNGNNEDKVSKIRRGRVTRSQSLGTTGSRQAFDKEMANMQCDDNSKLDGETKPENATIDQPNHSNDNNENKVSKIKRGCPARNQSLGTTSSQQAVNKENENTQCEEGIKLERETKPEKAALVQSNEANNKKENKVSNTKRGCPTRSESLGATTSQQATDNETAANKRRCLRQSARFKPQELQADVFELDVNTPHIEIESVNKPLRASNSAREPLSQSSENLMPQRVSIGRPSRKAAEKIQCYKEPPLHTKMRRPE